MSQNEKKVFGRHKKQEESPLEQTQAVPAVQDEIAAEPAAEASPKRNKYADKMNRKKRRLSKGARIGITAAAIALLLGGGIWAVVKSRDAGTENVTQTTAAVSCGDLETYIEGSGVTAAKKREELGREVKGKELTEAERGVSDAQLEVSKAQSDLSAAQRKLSRLHITAPFTGKLIPTKDSDNKDVSFRVGEQVSEGQVIGYMVNDRQMKLTLAFSAEYARSIRTGQAATVSIASAMSEVSGTVSSVETAQQISSEGVRVIRVGITVNNPGSLTKGMTATATINAGRLGAIYPANAGTLEYSREEAVTAQISGEIIKLNGTSYSTYNGGALIMSLSSDASQDEISAAQNGIAAANRTVASAKTVADEKRAHIAELQQKIQNSTVTSPIDGVVVSLNAVEGQEATGSETLVVVADLNDIVVNAEVSSMDIGSVQQGQQATMTMYASDGSEISLTGEVQSVALEPTQNSSNGQGSMPTFKAVMSVDPLEGQKIYSGMSIEYKITTASSYGCLMVPSSAIVNTDSGTAVFAKPLTDENGNEIPFEETLPIPEGTEGIPEDYQLVPVETGIADSTNTEILGGLEEGTEVFLAGPSDLYAEMSGDGMSAGMSVG